jgi:SAM-dependent methyltransferase
MSTDFFPSIWLAEFRSKAEYDEKVNQLSAAYSVYDWMDDRLLYSRHAMTNPAYCSVCGHVTQIRVDWTYGGFGPPSSIHPAWTETAICEDCGLNSRMRALIDFLKTHLVLSDIHHAYAAEQLTHSFRKLKGLLPSLVGSEFLGSDVEKGKTFLRWRTFRRLRHEDLTSLTFTDGEFDLAITQDVFEHIPDYQTAFSELLRILSPGGHLVFTIPFFPDLENTRIRASLTNNGIVHHLPPEIHGNPVSPEGSLCYQNFGWDILQVLCRVGFKDAFASMYWGPWQGHLGFPFFIFSAVK